MRILWLSHLIPYPPKGGVLQRSYNLLNELAKYHKVDLLAFHQPTLYKPIYDTQEEGLKTARSRLGEICENVEFFGIKASSPYAKLYLAFKSLFTKTPYNLNWLISDKYRDQIIDYVNTNKYDAIHFDTISLALYSKFTKNLPTVLDHHNIESHMLLRRAKNEKWNLLKKFYFWQEGIRLEKYEKIMCPKFSMNITCSDLDTKRLHDICNCNNITTIPNGVDTEFFKPNPVSEDKDKTKNIIFIGRLNWYPNIAAVKEIAFNIWPKLKTIIPDINSDIIGANPPKELLALGKKDSAFKVHGFVDNILPFMKQSNIYVCPIKDGGGTKLKILDALSMGMPIVAHPIACEGINVKENHDILFASTAGEFAIKIKHLIDNRDTAKQLGKNARSLVINEYSYHAIGKEFANIFDNIMYKN